MRSLLTLLSLVLSFMTNAQDVSVFAIQDLTHLKTQKADVELKRIAKRRCELEKELLVIPQTCYLIEPKANWGELDSACHLAVQSQQLTKQELTIVIASPKASERCKSYVKDRITVLNYKQASTNQ
jgi:hypothetical protein